MGRRAVRRQELFPDLLGNIIRGVELQANERIVQGDKEYRWRTLQGAVRPPRESHARQEGVVRKDGEEFPNGCKYPGDQDAPVGEWINCRCWLEEVTPEKPKRQRKRRGS